MKFHKICFFTIIPNFYKISSPRHGPCERHYNACKFQASCGPRRAEIAKLMEIGEFSRNSAFFGENHQKSGIFMEFHENGIKVRNLRFPSFRNTNLDLLFLVQIKPPRQGGEKYPEPPKITPFYRNSMEMGEIPLKSTKFGEMGVNRAPGGATRPRGSQNVAITMLFAASLAALPRARFQHFCFFRVKTQKSWFLWNFHEKVEFSMKFMEIAILRSQKHQFGLVIPCPNGGSAPGGRKVLRNTKNHQFYPKFTNFW